MSPLRLCTKLQFYFITCLMVWWFCTEYFSKPIVSDQSIHTWLLNFESARLAQNVPGSIFYSHVRIPSWMSPFDLIFNRISRWELAWPFGGNSKLFLTLRWWVCADIYLFIFNLSTFGGEVLADFYHFGIDFFTFPRWLLPLRNKFFQPSSLTQGWF